MTTKEKQLLAAIEWLGEKEGYSVDHDGDWWLVWDDEGGVVEEAPTLAGALLAAHRAEDPHAENIK